jgi:hypothetical protein
VHEMTPYQPDDEERAALQTALDEARANPDSLSDWDDVRSELRARARGSRQEGS